jgi:hypothetical protein
MEKIMKIYLAKVRKHEGADYTMAVFLNKEDADTFAKLKAEYLNTLLNITSWYGYSVEAPLYNTLSEATTIN